MTVYVDDMEAEFGRMVMCHMIADTTDELLDMARKIGVRTKWIQNAGTYREHFDVCKSKRAAALSLGAIPLTRKQLAQKLIDRRPAQALTALSRMEERNGRIANEPLIAG
jgi:Protein of unknown function (DUF4031)